MGQIDIEASISWGWSLVIPATARKLEIGLYQWTTGQRLSLANGLTAFTEPISPPFRS